MKDFGSHYEYLAVYLDDLIIVSKDPFSIIKELKQLGCHTLKGVGELVYYLGGDIIRTKDSIGKKMTTLSVKTYIKNICDKVERTFNITLKNYHSPLEDGYHPELCINEMIDDDEVSKHQMLIGSLN